MARALTLFLFDVDGVLVEPLAYRAGISETLKVLAAKIGLSNPLAVLPSAADVSSMEACGLHDVWDITNIAFALILMAVHRDLSTKAKHLAGQSLQDWLLAIKSHAPEIGKPDYAKFAQTIKAAHGSKHLPDAALELFGQELAKQENTNEGCWQNLLTAFLHDTRSPYENYGTRLFQNIVLGSKYFQATYQLESEYSGESLLRSKDRIAITPESVRTLFALTQRDDFRAAIYTARPSLPPADRTPLLGYSPEAELAVESCGLEGLPLVGMGMMDWLAQQHGLKSETLTKPNTTQALAAILAAVAKTCPAELLELAYRFDKDNQFNEELASLKGHALDVYVFEDTISGITPMAQVTTALRQNGYHIELHALGIATDENKVEALSKVTPKQFADVNQAFSYAVNASQSLEQKSF